jgi:hypothetical protein
MNQHQVVVLPGAVLAYAFHALRIR